MKKSLFDIQQEVRELDKKLKDISNDVAQIYNEIDELRNDESSGMDYKMIKSMSYNLPFAEHPLAGANDTIACQVYLETLLSLIQIDRGSDHTVDRLIFAQWLLMQARLKISIEEMLKDSMRINTNTFAELVEMIPKKYQEHLVMDVLLMANIGGLADNDVLVYIVGLCGIFGIEKEKLRVFSIIAKGILKQDFGKLKKSDMQQVLKHVKNFKHYINDDMFNASFTSQRMIVVNAPDDAYRDFKWTVKQHANVKKGDVIAKYRSRNIGSMIGINAPRSGTLFQFRNNCINYGVIAHESDNKDSVKAWAIKKR